MSVHLAIVQTTRSELLQLLTEQKQYLVDSVDDEPPCCGNRSARTSSRKPSSLLSKVPPPARHNATNQVRRPYLLRQAQLPCYTSKNRRVNVEERGKEPERIFRIKA